MDKNLHEKIDGPTVAVDTVVFAIDKEQLSTLLIRIGTGPYKDKWAVPGGLIRLNETPEDAAIRVLRDKTNIKKWHIEQLYSFGDPDRDVRGNIVSIAHLLLIADIEQYTLKTADFYTDIKWVPVHKLPPMAFDHEKIIKVAYQRLKDKMAYSSIASSLLSTNFTLTELQKVYEVVWGRKIDKRNFRKSMLDTGMIVPANKLKRGAFRPAQLYKFKGTKVVYF